MRPIPTPWLLIVLTAVYFAAGKLGLSFATINSSASAVWPPTGIALAAFLLFGNRVWPAIFAGAFLVNATTAGTVFTSIGIAAGNTAEGLVGAYLVTRYASGAACFERAMGRQQSERAHHRADDNLRAIAYRDFAQPVYADADARRIRP